MRDTLYERPLTRNLLNSMTEQLTRGGKFLTECCWACGRLDLSIDFWLFLPATTFASSFWLPNMQSKVPNIRSCWLWALTLLTYCDCYSVVSAPHTSWCESGCEWRADTVIEQRTFNWCLKHKEFKNSWKLTFLEANLAAGGRKPKIYTEV